MLKAGTAEIDITPEVGSNIPGQWLRRKAESVRDPLLVNALVLESGKTRLALVSADALSLKNRVVSEARNLILNMTGIPPGNVFLAATHTHTGPPVVDALGTESDATAVNQFTNAIAAAVAGADRKLQPVQLATWSGQAPGLAFPRRFHMRDGTVRMHPPKGSPDTLDPEDVADPTIAGFHVWNEDGRLLAACVNFACHAIVVGGASYYSADYPGAVRRALKRLYRDETTVLHFNGPCGDVGPDDVQDTSRTRRGEEWLDCLGGGIAGFAAGYGSVAAAQGSMQLAAAGTSLPVPLRPIPDFLLRRAQATLTDDEIETPPQDMERIRLREYVLLDRERQKQDHVEAEIMALRVGDAAVVGLPGEVFADMGRRIRAASPSAHTLVVELANGCHGYVPTQKAFRGGGYETWLARSSKLVPAAGDMMVEAAAALLTGLDSDRT